MWRFCSSSRMWGEEGKVKIVGHPQLHGDQDVWDSWHHLGNATGGLHGPLSLPRCVRCLSHSGPGVEVGAGIVEENWPEGWWRRLVEDNWPEGWYRRGLHFYVLQFVLFSEASSEAWWNTLGDCLEKEDCLFQVGFSFGCLARLHKAKCLGSWVSHERAPESFPWGPCKAPKRKLQPETHCSSSRGRWKCPTCCRMWSSWRTSSRLWAQEDEVKGCRAGIFEVCLKALLEAEVFEVCRAVYSN